MPKYVQQFGGYIADVPHFWFRRCDGKVFYFDELTQASTTPQINNTEINAGWSVFPVATLPGQGTFEMQLTSGKFYADMFTMANATEFSENQTYRMPMTEQLIIDATAHTVTLAEAPATGSIVINGLTMVEGAEPGVGEFSVAEKVITFNAEETGTVLINYEYETSAQEALIDNQSSAIGEAIMVYPVYGTGDDCTKSGTIGKVILKVFKARVTGQPGLNGSYKSASTFDMTLSAMDAKRADGAAYSIAYVANA